MSERLEDLEWGVGDRHGGEPSGWILALESEPDFWRYDFALGDCGKAGLKAVASRVVAALNYVRGMTTEEIEAATQAKFAVKGKSRELSDWSFKRHREEVESRS